MTLALQVLALAGAAIAFWLLTGGYGQLRDRRARRLSRRDVEARVAELQARPAPEALPRARDLTKAEVRALRGRRHPIARKRRTGRWG